MGSSGSDSFSDYSEQKPTSADADNGGASKIDKCALAFACSIEEVSRCSYFKSKGIPSIETEVLVKFNGVRLAAVAVSSGEEIGYLPTKFNYIKNCIDAGFSYGGVVRAISISPNPYVLVDITPL